MMFSTKKQKQKNYIKIRRGKKSLKVIREILFDEFGVWGLGFYIMNCVILTYLSLHTFFSPVSRAIEFKRI
jgi:hypothetical protein